MVKEGQRFKDKNTKKECIVKTVTRDKIIILQCIDRLSESYVTESDLLRFFEELD